jgi:hypothetical protein
MAEVITDGETRIAMHLKDHRSIVYNKDTGDQTEAVIPVLSQKPFREVVTDRGCAFTFCDNINLFPFKVMVHCRRHILDGQFGYRTLNKLGDMTPEIREFLGIPEWAEECLDRPSEYDAALTQWPDVLQAWPDVDETYKLFPGAFGVASYVYWKFLGGGWNDCDPEWLIKEGAEWDLKKNNPKAILKKWKNGKQQLCRLLWVACGIGPRSLAETWENGCLYRSVKSYETSHGRSKR